MLGQPVEDFSLPSTGGTTFQLSSARGHGLVLYFYPKDNTPGCTAEGADFRDRYAEFRAVGFEVLGVSRDSIKSHENFRAKMGFPFALLSDRDEVLCNRFGVIKMKTMFGKQVRGIVRSTFVIDEHGVLLREWRGIKVPGHVEEVLRFVQSR
jgi:peroxiredoxin Q/BCP